MRTNEVLEGDAPRAEEAVVRLELRDGERIDRGRASSSPDFAWRKITGFEVSTSPRPCSCRGVWRPIPIPQPPRAGGLLAAARATAAELPHAGRWRSERRVCTELIREAPWSRARTSAGRSTSLHVDPRQGRRSVHAGRFLRPHLHLPARRMPLYDKFLRSAAGGGNFHLARLPGTRRYTRTEYRRQRGRRR